MRNLIIKAKICIPYGRDKDKRLNMDMENGGTKIGKSSTLNIINILTYKNSGERTSPHTPKWESSDQ